MSERVITPNDQCPATVAVEGETVRCWRWLSHEGPHMATDGVRWAATERPASAPLLDATGPEVQRRPGNLSDDYPPYPQAPKVDA